MLRFRRLDSQVLGVRWSTPLHVAGEIPAVPRVAIVGSRAAQRRYLECLPAMVGALAEAGASVVSGGALGVDAAVHREALVQRVPQVAILPGPPDALYPPDHGPLFERIVAAGGGVVCAQPPGIAMTRAMFSSRNVIVVQLSCFVVGLQAGARSGTRTTLGLALRHRVPVAGVLGTPGVAWMIGRGGVSLGLPEPSAVGESLRAFLRGQPLRRPLPPEFRALEQPFSRRPSVTADDFDDALEASALLVEAHAQGWVAEVAPGRYVRASQG